MFDGIDNDRKGVVDVDLLSAFCVDADDNEYCSDEMGAGVLNPHCRRISIMMLTVINQAQRAFGLGVEAYLTKPFDEQKVITEVRRLLNKRVEPRRVVVLGQKEDSRTALKTSASTTHTEDIGGLESALTMHGYDIALVVSADFQETTERLCIQQMVGTRPCLFLCLDPTPRWTDNLGPYYSVGVDNV